MTYPWAAGEVLTAADLNAYAGLVLVKTQTVGSAVASVTVSDAFSSAFENYLIVDSGGSMSVNTIIGLKLGATATGYFYSLIRSDYTSSTLYVEPGNNQASWPYTSGGAANRTGVITLSQPHATLRTRVSVQMAAYDTFFINFQGFLNDTTSYTAFTLTPASGTMTGGTIRVYGYNNG